MSESMPAKVKSRDELKQYFRNGMLPDESRFADLIESMAHRDDLAVMAPHPAPPPQPVPDPSPKPVPEPSPKPVPEPAGSWQRVAGRSGSYRPGPDLALLPPVASLDLPSAPADGARYAILSELTGCAAFEIVASASAGVDSRCHSITQAVALLSVKGDRCGVRHTFSYLGWDWRRKIRLRWQKGYDGYDLNISTGVDFGMDDDGQPVQIRYHITRLW